MPLSVSAHPCGLKRSSQHLGHRTSLALLFRSCSRKTRTGASHDTPFRCRRTDDSDGRLLRLRCADARHLDTGGNGPVMAGAPPPMEGDDECRQGPGARWTGNAIRLRSDRRVDAGSDERSGRYRRWGPPQPSCTRAGRPRYARRSRRGRPGVSGKDSGGIRTRWGAAART